MEVRDYLRQKVYKLDSVESTGYIDSGHLLNLLSNKKLKDYIIHKYQLTENIRINLDKVDIIYDLVKKYSSRFLLLRLKNSFDQVLPYLKLDEVDGKRRVHFQLTNSVDAEVTIYEDVQAEAIYDSVGMFYDSRKLTTYVNYLKEKDASGYLLQNLNESWREYYRDNPKEIETKIFRVLDDGENQYLKSINSDRYNEWGISETFVVGILELYKLSRSKIDFHISSVALSESKIDIIVSSNRSKYIEDLGFVFSSISIRNEDQGNTSIGLYSSLEFKLEKEVDGRIFLFPNKKYESIENKFTMNHSVTEVVFVDGYERISTLLREMDNFENDYYVFRESIDYDQVRAKIEEKVTNNNSPFRGITEVADLFKKDKVGHISNLVSLLKLCGRAETVEKLEFDLKFKLRYIISNVFLYG